jgi:hypothetical protein
MDISDKTEYQERRAISKVARAVGCNLVGTIPNPFFGSLIVERPCQKSFGSF